MSQSHCAVDRPKDYRWTFVLAASQRLNDGYVVVDPDHPVLWRGYKVESNQAMLRGVFLRFYTEDGWQSSSVPIRLGEMNNAGLAGGSNLAGGYSGSLCRPMVPERIILPGRKILIELRESLAVGPQTIKITFVCVKRAFA